MTDFGFPKYARVEVRSNFARPKSSLIGQRGYVVSADHTHVGVMVDVILDGKEQPFPFFGGDLRRLSLLELIAEAAQ